MPLRPLFYFHLGLPWPNKHLYSEWNFMLAVMMNPFLPSGNTQFPRVNGGMPSISITPTVRTVRRQSRSVAPGDDAPHPLP